MSNEIKPMTIFVVAVMPDGTTRFRSDGRAHLGDLLLAAKDLDLRAASAFQRAEVEAAVQSRRNQIAVVPEGAIPPELLKREG